MDSPKVTPLKKEWNEGETEVWDSPRSPPRSGKGLKKAFSWSAETIADWGILPTLGLVAGAALSFVDVVFDFMMIRQYQEDGQAHFANATMISIGISLALQVFLIFMQNRKRGKRVVLRECLFVVTFVKPGVDVWRVSHGNKQEPLTIFDPLVEMIYTRIMELIAESIPGTIIQTLAILYGQNSTIAWLSLLFSILTSTFITTAITVEKDVEIKSRRKNPSVYGFLPLHSVGRSLLISLTLFFVSMCQLATKVFAMALCSVVSFTMLFIYLTAEMVLYFAYKIARGNFWCKYAIYTPKLRFFASCVLLVLPKLMFDFTGITNCRGPQFLGGAYSLFITISNPFVCLLFGWMYLEHLKDEAFRATFSCVFPPETVYAIIGGFGFLQIFSSLLFLNFIGPKYRNTFTSFKTMPELVQEEFLTFTEPDLKIKVFGLHKELWAPIATEVRTWLNGSRNLVRWVKEKPAWFTDHVKASILDEFVDDEMLLIELRGANVQAIMERRKSFGGVGV